MPTKDEQDDPKLIAGMIAVCERIEAFPSEERSALVASLPGWTEEQRDVLAGILLRRAQSRRDRDQR
jgi:hypothetical protein